jgi:hypothetical protein
MSLITRAIYDYIKENPGVCATDVVIGLQSKIAELHAHPASIISYISFLTKAELLQGIKTKGALHYTVDNDYSEEAIRQHRHHIYRKHVERSNTVSQAVQDTKAIGIVSPNQDPANINCSIITHTFMLRPGMAIQITLPTDLSHEEAQRLSINIRLLPFAPKIK